MEHTKRNIQLTIDKDLIKWLEENHIKKSELVNELLKKYRLEKQEKK